MRYAVQWQDGVVGGGYMLVDANSAQEAIAKVGARGQITVHPTTAEFIAEPPAIEGESRRVEEVPALSNPSTAAEGALQKLENPKP